jgi:hypothetical protein
MLMIIRRVVAWVKVEIDTHRDSLWNDEYVLHLSLGGGYTGEYNGLVVFKLEINSAHFIECKLCLI